MITSVVSNPVHDDDAHWYKHAIIYQLHVRAFHDSNADGIGDFRGLTQKLDYLQELGVTALWLLPFYPSPLRDDGYDTADYTDVHPNYGTLRDCKEFIAESHRRGLRVITELVLNHTSDQHRWFQRARHAPPGSNFRDFYVWSDTDEKYEAARIIFKDFENSNWSWDPVAQAYYWHRFYAHQPDLNFDNPNVHRALLRVLDFWFKLGVDGLRLDAVPYLYEREGTTCENLPETHAFLKKLRAHVDGQFRNRMLLAEANQWPEDAIAYFGKGDECHMAFHFPLMPRLFMGIRMEDRYPIIDILQQTPPIPDSCQWAVFLRNHDELTLEMVTDEERDYMYRVYANDRQARINLGIRRRLSPLLGNNRRKIELMNGLLFSLPGTPVLYYGDEIGMGDNVYLGDRNSVRTPMQWSPDRNAGFSRANPQRLYLPIIIDPEYHFETVNVEAQQSNTHSMLWWVRRLIALRQRYPVFGEGSLEFLHPENPKVLAFIRRSKQQCVLVVANLSRFVQCVELELTSFEGSRPVELFGGTAFPPVGNQPYFLTLGPHSFYWFSMQRAPARPEDRDTQRDKPTLAVSRSWEELFQGRSRKALEAALPHVLSGYRWFGGKAQTISQTTLFDAVPIASEKDSLLAVIALIEVNYADNEPEMYQVPMACAAESRQAQIEHDTPEAVLFRTRTATGEVGIVFDAVYEPRFRQGVLEAMIRRRRFRGRVGQVLAQGSPPLRSVELEDYESGVSKADQSNTSIIYGDDLILKLFRRCTEGINPDLELGRFLTQRARFKHTPAILGSLEYTTGTGEPRTLGVLQAFVMNEGDAWRHTLSALGAYFENARTRAGDDSPEPTDVPILQRARQGPPSEAVEAIGLYLQSAELIGRRTAEMHIALSSIWNDPAVSGERFTPHHQRSMYQSMRNITRHSLRMLRRQLSALTDQNQVPAREILENEQEILNCFRRVLSMPLTGMRIRTHGDYHLAQLLYTGRDFLIIDFEGEPGRVLSERRIKRSALRDVAGMLRSFDYAANVALREHGRLWGEATESVALQLKAWAGYWREWVAGAFLRAYLDTAQGAVFLPKSDQEILLLLESFLLEKAVFELGYELNNRPDWVEIPLDGIAGIIASQRETWAP